MRAARLRQGLYNCSLRMIVREGEVSTSKGDRSYAPDKPFSSFLRRIGYYLTSQWRLTWTISRNSQLATHRNVYFTKYLPFLIFLENAGVRADCAIPSSTSHFLSHIPFTSPPLPSLSPIYAEL